MAFLLTETITFAATDKIVFPTQAYANANNLYYSVGNDGGGILCRYDKKTKDITQLGNEIGGYQFITEYKGYIYYSQDVYGGTTFTDCYIFRMSANGNSVKKLAKGFCPVILGNCIYYIATEKEIEYGSTVFDKRKLGLYKMDLNGANKKRLYRNSNISKIGCGKQGIYIKTQSGGNIKWYRYSLKNKKVSLIDIKKFYTNESLRISYWTNPETVCNVYESGYKYTYSGGKVYRIKGKNKKCILSTEGNVRKLICSNGNLVAISEKESRVYVYTSLVSGKQKCLLRTFMVAGGDWDY